MTPPRLIMKLSNSWSVFQLLSSCPYDMVRVAVRFCRILYAAVVLKVYSFALALFMFRSLSPPMVYFTLILIPRSRFCSMRKVLSPKSHSQLGNVIGAVCLYLKFNVSDGVKVPLQLLKYPCLLSSLLPVRLNTPFNPFFEA